MESDSISDEVKRFILTSIPSVPFLEAILLTRDCHNQMWSTRHVAQRLYIQEKDAERILTALYEMGALVRIGAPVNMYQYQPSSDELRAMVDRLAHTYARDIIAVTNLIHSRSSRQAHLFADAFKWRKDE